MPFMILVLSLEVLYFEKSLPSFSMIHPEVYNFQQFVEDIEQIPRMKDDRG